MKKARVFMVWLCMFLVLFVGCTGNQNTKSVSENKTEKEEVKEEVKQDVKEDVTITYLRPGTEVENNGELLQAINDKLKADGMNLKLEIMYIPSECNTTILIRSFAPIGRYCINFTINSS